MDASPTGFHEDQIRLKVLSFLEVFKKHSSEKVMGPACET